MRPKGRLSDADIAVLRCLLRRVAALYYCIALYYRYCHVIAGAHGGTRTPTPRGTWT